MRNSTSFVLLLLGVALVYTVAFPYYDKIMVLRGQSDQYKTTLQDITNLTKRRDDLSVVYQNLPQEEVKRLEKVLPDNVDTVNLAMNFDSIAAKYGVSIKKISTVDRSSESGVEIVQSVGNGLYEPVTVVFSFVAGYEDFRSFIADIEQSLRIIDIKSIAFESSETGLYDFSLEVETYWLKE